MTREEFRNYVEFLRSQNEISYDIYSALIDGIDALEQEPKWIPVSERLPERQWYYICTCKDGTKYKRTTFVKWSNGWQLTGARAYWIVLAWMPLPAPFESQESEE